MDTHPGAARWVKNDHVGFAIPYRKRNIPARYYPDFIAVMDDSLRLVTEVKGRYDDAPFGIAIFCRCNSAAGRENRRPPFQYR